MKRYLLALSAFATFICVLAFGMTELEQRVAPPAVSTTPVQSQYTVGDVISLRATTDARSMMLVTAAFTGELTIHRAVTDDTRLCADGFGCTTVGELRKGMIR